MKNLLRSLKSSGSGTGTGTGVGTGIGTRPGIQEGVPGGSAKLAMIIIFSALGTALVLIAILYAWYRRRRPENFRTETFESTVERERKRATQRRSSTILESLMSLKTQFSTPDDGLYAATYINTQRKEVKLIYDLQFKDDNENGYIISGHVTEKNNYDSFLTIKEGYVRCDGKAFWKAERESSSSAVVTTGSFNFKNQTFQGTWLASDGMRMGAYSSFHKATPKKNKDPNSL